MRLISIILAWEMLEPSDAVSKASEPAEVAIWRHEFDERAVLRIQFAQTRTVTQRS